VTLHAPQHFAQDLADGAVPPGQVVVLSQSGASVTSIEAVRAAAQASMAVLAITANAGSPIAALGAEVFVLPIGEERIGPKTKGFTASVAALLALAGVPGSPGEVFGALIEPARAQAAELLALADGADCLTVTGAGALYGIALEASLKVAEVAGLPTAAYPWEEVLHGRLHGLTGRSACVVLSDDPGTQAEALAAQAAMGRRGATVQVLACAGALAPPWSALAAVLPFQFLAVLLAQARGRDPDAMRYPGLSADLGIKTAARA
jgi:fructoselysine-6-P-deglycase FrlB-like protein